MRYGCADARLELGRALEERRDVPVVLEGYVAERLEQLLMLSDGGLEGLLRLPCSGCSVSRLLAGAREDERAETLNR